MPLLRVSFRGNPRMAEATGARNHFGKPLHNRAIPYAKMTIITTEKLIRALAD